MTIATYSERAFGLAEELLDSLSEQDVAGLRISLSAMTIADWIAWRDAHARTVRAYVAATPATRRHFELETGPSYRQMAAEAGAACQALTAIDGIDWPFDGAPPFVG